LKGLACFVGGIESKPPDVMFQEAQIKELMISSCPFPGVPYALNPKPYKP
jgi:hypothetical protein